MYKKLMIIYLGILASMAPLATDMYLPSLPELQADFGSSTVLIQLTLTMTTLVWPQDRFLLDQLVICEAARCHFWWGC